MANDEHIALLKKGVAAWNAWREANPAIRPDLRGADLSGARLVEAHLSKANLSEANLSDEHDETTTAADPKTSGRLFGAGHPTNDEAGRRAMAKTAKAVRDRRRERLRRAKERKRVARLRKRRRGYR